MAPDLPQGHPRPSDVITAHARARSALADARTTAESSPVEGGMNVDDEEDVSNSDGSINGEDAPTLLPSVDIDAPLSAQLAYAASHAWGKCHHRL